MRTRLTPLVLATLALSLAGCDFIPQWSPARTDLGGDRVEVPLEIVAGNWVLRGRSASGEYLVHLDTGCRDVTLMPSLAQDLAAREHTVFPSISTDSAGNAVTSWSAWRVPTFSFGPATFHSFDADVLDCSHIFGPTVRALVGMNLFRDCLLTLDLANNRLILTRGELPPANGTDTFDYQSDLAGNILVPATIGGVKVQAKLDTGFSGIVSTSSATAKRLPLVGPPAPEAWVSLHRADNPGFYSRELDGNLVIGPISVSRPRVTVGDAHDYLLVGTEILKGWTLTFDQKNRRIRITRFATSASQ